MPEILDLLEEVDDFLDNYVDVNDGDDGQPVPNRAMDLQSRARELHRWFTKMIATNGRGA